MSSFYLAEDPAPTGTEKALREVKECRKYDSATLTPGWRRHREANGTAAAAGIVHIVASLWLRRLLQGWEEKMPGMSVTHSPQSPPSDADIIQS